MLIQIIVLIGFVYVLYYYGLMWALCFFAGGVISLATTLTILEFMVNPKKYMK